MTACNDFIKKLETTLPDQCSVNDLLRIGLYTSAQSARHARQAGDSPAYFQIRRRIFYPKQAVIDWLHLQKHETIQ